MEVILLNKKTESWVVEFPVVAFSLNLINSNDKLKRCFIVYYEDYTKTYPCDEYDLHCITKR